MTAQEITTRTRSRRPAPEPAPYIGHPGTDVVYANGKARVFAGRVERKTPTGPWVPHLKVPVSDKAPVWRILPGKSAFHLAMMALVEEHKKLSLLLGRPIRNEKEKKQQKK